jgi:hypothetical protein
MSWSNNRILFTTLGFCLVLLVGGTGLIYSGEPANQDPGDGVRLPVVIGYTGSSDTLERPEVTFDHDRHTKALKQVKKADCKVCHVLEEKNDRVTEKKVQTFKFPKVTYDARDKDSIRDVYHAVCGDCHRKRAKAGKKSGPDIGLCGKCHVRKAEIKKVAWAWAPIFNYAVHDRHVGAIDKLTKPVKALPKVIREIGAAGDSNKTDTAVAKKCYMCHHIYDEKRKYLIHKKDTENSCKACHKEKDEKNARSMKMVAHAQCIGCHMELAEATKKELVEHEKKELAEKTKKKFGPFECKGCHGKHEILKAEAIAKIPRLVRGQKDVVDVFLKDPKKDPKATRMKLVPFNHKAHETRAQFCSSCHHYSLEKCVNCHTPSGDLKRGEGINFERAFHKFPAKQSCRGCHEVRKQEKECAGCHQWLTTEMPQRSCPICHRGTSEGKPIEVAPVPLVFDKEKVPEKVTMKGLEKEFKPAEMPHQKITKKLTEISNNSSLARFFHVAKTPDDQTLCEGCHHYSREPAAKKFPGCRACHSRPFDPRQVGKPGIMAAYHQQCIGCHKVMGQKPKALECDKCHALREPGKAVKVEIPLRGFWK